MFKKNDVMFALTFSWPTTYFGQQPEFTKMHLKIQSMSSLALLHVTDTTHLVG